MTLSPLGHPVWWLALALLLVNDNLLKGAMGRRNYLFCGSDESARRHAIISTVLGNCALAGVNPFAYLRDVIAKLAGDWPNARIAELMPAAWAAAQKKTKDSQTQQTAVA